MKRELKNLRKRNEKHFLNEDGTIQAIIYNDNVHYFKDGVYEEIDNTLVEKDDRFHIVGNSFDLSFSKESDEKLLEVSKSNYYFQMSIRDIRKMPNKKLKIDNKIRKKGSISYNGIFDNIDLNYQILPKEIKETIVINDRNSVRDRFVFDIKTNLELTLKNNRIVSDKFTILESFMVDSNEVVNNEIYYILNKVTDGYELILVLDKAWLECEERKYPIYIDPTIITEESDDLEDTYISSKYPDTNYCTSEILKASMPTADEICRSLIKFNLPAIATGSNVIDSQMYVYECPYNYPAGTYYSHHATIHRITDDWNVNTATWNNMNDKYDTKIEDYKYSEGEVNITSFTADYVSFNITNLVKRWYAGSQNYGLMIKAHKEEYHNNLLCHDFISKDYNNSESDPKPVLTVTYRNKNGLDSYLTYQNQILSSSVIYENNYNGNVIIVFNLGNTVGGQMPASLKLFYNTNDVILNKNYGFGIGMQLNVQQIIRQSDLTQSDINLYEYVDEDGTIHYFVPKKENDEIVENKFVDEDGLLLNLSILNETCEIKDKFGNYKVFSKIGNIYYLTKIVDLNNNQIIISYIDTKISSITDANGQQISINYQDSSITITSPVNTSVLTLNNNKLTKIEDNFGTVFINYNSNNIINLITDINGKKIGLEYYEMIPYRVKKVLEYSTSNEVGKTLSFNYGFEATQVTNNKGICNTYTFNESGNTVSISNLGMSQNINECYGKEIKYGSHGSSLNKLVSKSNKVKTVNNLIWNSGFEKDYNIFSGDDSLQVSITNEFCLDGNRSLKLSGYGNAYASIPVVNSGSYTFSFYSKAYDEYSLWLCSGTDYSDTLVVKPSVEFERYEITIDNVESGSNIEIFIYVSGILTNNVYIDNIQLEEGKVANYYNLIDNNNFKYNLSGWIYDNSENNIEFTIDDVITFKTIDNRTDEIITYENGGKAFKLVCDPTVTRHVTRYIDVNGLEGDMLQFSFWYKNSGLAKLDNFPEGRHNTVQFILWPSNEEDSGDGYFTYADLNSNSNEWQYYSTTIRAPYDYDKFRMSIMSEWSANELYVTNFNLFKVDGLLSNSYDENGNIIATYDKSSNENTFKYDTNNQLINMTNPIGGSLSYEYDNDITDRILSGISPTGITNSIKYDNNSNPIFTRIENKTKLNLESGNYYIRAKGTNKYLKFDSLSKNLVLKEDACSHAKWEVIINNNTLIFKSLLQNLVYLNDSDLSTIIFTFEKQDNGSFTLKTNDKYLTIDADNLTLSSVVNLNKQQFYFEIVDPIYIESSAEYSTDGRFLTKTIDTLFNEVSYNVNTANGLINSVTDQSGAVTNYTYNSKNQLTGITKGNMAVNYEYNSNNLLSKIIQTNKTYNLNYDEFFNTKSFYINDNKIIEKTYENNNGNLLNTIYGNGNTISYEYDQFNRISKLTRMDNIYIYDYDNFGNLKKVDSNNYNNLYCYDLSQRLIDLKGNDNYRIHYDYNSINNINSKIVSLDDSINEYMYEYNNEGNITKITNDNTIINYTYDELQRLIQISINGGNISCSYLTNGKRVSTLIDTFTDGTDIYKFKYDKLGNIIKIYKNNNLTKEYYYDVSGQLIKEENSTGSIIYTYDNFGNILSKVSYGADNSIITTDTYEYGNIDFKDQLTKYNNISITYDNIGNPLTIGTDTLTWINGRQLNSYSNSDLSVSYKYNDAGIRVEKTVNNITYKYYLEGKYINYVQIAENVLYFIRDINNKLIGFKYNADVYYYIKNAQDDIIGIKDSNLNTIALYEYDSFGKILSIKDVNGNQIISDTHVAHINPFRFRSYYYDNETGFYYLNSRYYNPTWGRFINLDGIVGANMDILSLNLYSYCSNNFINYSDVAGKSILGALLFMGAVGASAGVGSQFVNDLVTSVINKDLEFSSWETYVGSAVNGMTFTYGFAFTGNVVFAGALSGFVGSGTRETIEHFSRGEDISVNEIVKDTVVGGLSSMLKPKLPGITNGRNSYSAIYNSSITKLKNSTISNVSSKTFYKSIASEFAGGLYSYGISGIQGAFEIDSSYINVGGSEQYIIDQSDGPLWCPVEWDQ